MFPSFQLFENSSGRVGGTPAQTNYSFAEAFWRLGATTDERIRYGSEIRPEPPIHEAKVLAKELVLRVTTFATAERKRPDAERLIGGSMQPIARYSTSLKTTNSK